MRLTRLPALLLALLPLVTGEVTRGGVPGKGGNLSGTRGQQNIPGPSQNQIPSSQGKTTNNGSRRDNNHAASNSKFNTNANLPNNGFRLASYNHQNIKQYFTQPKTPSNPWMVYQTPLKREAEIFYLTNDGILWFNSTNPELLGDIYSFFYYDKLDEPGELRYVGFWIREGIEHDGFEGTFFRWSIESDGEDDRLSVVYPGGLVFGTCPVEVEGLFGERNEWFVSTLPWKGDLLGCRRIEVFVEYC